MARDVARYVGSSSDQQRYWYSACLDAQPLADEGDHVENVNSNVYLTTMMRLGNTINDHSWTTSCLDGVVEEVESKRVGGGKNGSYSSLRFRARRLHAASMHVAIVGDARHDDDNSTHWISFGSQ
jgi:hypothetical protein